MKNTIFIILIFISTCCLAVNQKLIDGANKYNDAIKSLEKIESDTRSAHSSLEYWTEILNKDKHDKYADGLVKFEQSQIDEKNKQINSLGVQYNAAKEAVKKYEPLKKEYDKQKAKEEKRSERIAKLLDFAGTTLMPLCILVFLLRVSTWSRKKYERLLNEGKISKKEYEEMMQGDDSSEFSDSGINPSTGLPMVGVGISDVGGNARGSSSYQSSYNYSQEHRDRHRWD